MKPGDLDFFIAVEKQAARLVKLIGLPPIMFVPLSATESRRFWGLAYFEDHRIGLSLRYRFKTRWGKPHLAYQITDTICHEVAHIKRMNPFHDTRFMRLHSKYLALACKHEIHRAIEHAVSTAP